MRGVEHGVTWAWHARWRGGEWSRRRRAEEGASHPRIEAERRAARLADGHLQQVETRKRLVQTQARHRRRRGVSCGRRADDASPARCSGKAPRVPHGRLGSAASVAHEDAAPTAATCPAAAAQKVPKKPRVSGNAELLTRIANSLKNASNSNSAKTSGSPTVEAVSDAEGDVNGKFWRRW